MLTSLGAIMVLALSIVRADSASLRPAKIFADGAVIQRGRSVPIWGLATPRGTVAIDFRGRHASAHAGADGRWRVSIASGDAGGPFELTISSGAERVVLHDVLVGDVWFASGQSNMEFALAGSRDGPAVAAAANDSMIRQFKIPPSSSTAPEAELAGGSWKPADARNAAQFSAVAYYFAKDVRRATHVPIGIINSSWGGSAIESWLSASASGFGADAWKAISAREAAKDDSAFASLRGLVGPSEKDAGAIAGTPTWATPQFDDHAWSTMPVPAYWDGHGYGAFDGIGWYRTSVMLDSATAATALSLAIDGVDDNDVSWINGTEVGRTQGNARGHAYRIPAGVLHAGANSVAIRVTDNGGGGGLVAPVKLVNTQTSAVVRNLAGQWQFRASDMFEKSMEERMKDGQKINKIPTLLYNKMVYPLLAFPMKGVLWYQGESNANTDAQGMAYRKQFASLVTSWRREFGSRSLPFLWVQLPNYGDRDSVPPLNSTWGLVRESTAASLALPATGEAITIDIGEGDNIHPKNKADVGARLARVALKSVYGQKLDVSGPTYRSWSVKDHCALVRFDHAAGLQTHDGAAVEGFALAGADKQFAWATATIAGESVRVCSDRVTTPVAVRYAFANNPPATLYNAAGLPAAPFRTDHW